MSKRFDGELDDLFPDPDLRQAAELIARAGPLEIQPEAAFRSQLRRTLMTEAWGMAERKQPFWRRIFAGPGLAWAGAAVGAALIAVVAVSFATARPGRIETVTFGSPIADARQVSLVEPIELNFSAAMDQQSVERSITISPATQVTYQWTSPTTVKITPVAGDLAPNTQYQVKIGASASTVTHQAMARPQTITFTTAPAPVASPKPTPTPVAGPRVSMEKQLLQLPAGSPWYQWSPDGATIYALGQGGSILSMPAAGGSTSTLVAAGASLATLSADGTQLLFLKDGRLQQVATRDGKLTDVATPDAPPVATGWQPGPKPIWVTNDGTVLAGSPGGRLATLPAGAQSISIAPTGDRIAYTSARIAHVLELATSRDLAAGEATPQTWTGDGRFAILIATGGPITVGPEGPGSLAPAPPGLWESRGEALLNLPAGLTEIAAAGKLYRQLAAGDYQLPAASTDGNSFLFARNGFLWSARITSSVPGANARAADDTGKFVSDFMTARLAQDPAAQGLLDAGGRASYSGGGLSLFAGADPKFTRWFTIYGDQASRYVVRLVLSQDSHEAAYVDETLTLVRTPDGKLLVDRATGTPVRKAGAGPEVIGVQQAGGQVQVSFDSDLDETTLARGLALVDSTGKPLAAQVTYKNRTVTLAPTTPGSGSPSKLAVQTGLKDVAGRVLQAEFDLDLAAP